MIPENLYKLKIEYILNLYELEVSVYCNCAFNLFVPWEPQLFLFEIARVSSDGDAFTFPCVHPEFSEFQAIKAAVLYVRSCAGSSFVIELDCQWNSGLLRPC